LRAAIDRLVRHARAALAERAGLDALPLGNEAIFMLSKLPNLHRDPFDRLLICEAIQHGLTLISSDKMMRRYPVKLQWT
jgi:PIN domain nuclease of toxin-antitoxin system